MKNNFERAFTVLTLATLFVFSSLAVYFNFGRKWQEDIWSTTLGQLMSYYLVVVVIRALVILIFSFVEHFFKAPERKTEFQPLVSVIVPCFNEEKVVKQAVKSVSEMDYPNLEILLIDDGSVDDTTAIAKGLEHKEKRLRVVFKENGGKAEALNRGISEALGEYILCMDADSVLNRDSLERAMPYFSKDPNLAAVSGCVRVGNDHNLLCQFQKLEYVIGLNLHKKAQSLLNLVTIVPGPIGIFKKSAVQAVGCYHAQTFAEDCDLSMRLLFAGYNIKYSPDVVAHTETPATFDALMVQRYRWTRGVIQSIVKSAGLLTPRQINFRNSVIVAYMVLETIAIPLINFVFAMITLQQALIHGTIEMLGGFFIGLTFLDVCLSLYSLMTEKERSFYLLLAAVNRVTYGFALEILRFFAIFDELFKIPMRWGKIKRTGMEL